VQRDGRMRDAQGRDYWAYEIDGFRQQLFMDDANVPSLLGLPYLGCCNRDDPTYQRTRELVWSAATRTSTRPRRRRYRRPARRSAHDLADVDHDVRADHYDTAQIRQCLTWLRNTDAGTGFMHEAFDQDDPSHFTRSWFAWANTLFGELIIDIHREHPELLRA
jgi:meiotically up-regulated gene 157 (Mug157) protein